MVLIQPVGGCGGAKAVGHQAEFDCVQQTPILLTLSALVSVPGGLLAGRVAGDEVVRRCE